MGTPSTTYWVVMKAAGDVSDYYTWLKSTLTSGASTSTNGTTWTVTKQWIDAQRAKAKEKK